MKKSRDILHPKNPINIVDNKFLILRKDKFKYQEIKAKENIFKVRLIKI